MLYVIGINNMSITKILREQAMSENEDYYTEDYRWLAADKIEAQSREIVSLRQSMNGMQTITPPAPPVGPGPRDVRGGVLRK